MIIPPLVDDRIRLPFSAWWPVIGGALAGLAMRLIFSGTPGAAFSAMLEPFVYGSPMLVGALTVYLAERRRRRTWKYYFLAPMVATLLYVLGSLLILIEGWICAILIFPMFAVIGGVAGLAMGAICRATNWPRHGIVGGIAVLPVLMGAFGHPWPLAEQHRVQERAIFVAAPPAAVWRELVDVRDIAPHEVGHAWMYRIGVPLPVAGAADLRDGERLRHVTMGKGIRFDQVAVEWRENQAVTWEYRFAPDSFPPRALDDHVRIGGEYFDLGATRYSLVPERGGTRLHISMSYRVSTGFNWYAGPIADWLVGDFAEVILAFYGARAAGAASPGPSS